MLLKRYISLCVLLLVSIISTQTSVRAQQCPSNMLQLLEDGGHVSVADAPALRLNSAFTVETWVKLYSTIDRTTSLEKGNGGNHINYSLSIGPFNTVVARVFGPTGLITVTSEFILNIADWHYYALVF